MVAHKQKHRNGLLPTPARPADLPEAAATVGNDLDGWTSDELFAEALARTAGDVPALRLMQDVVLEARLTAHDRESAHEHVGG